MLSRNMGLSPCSMLLLKLPSKSLLKIEISTEQNDKILKTSHRSESCDQKTKHFVESSDCYPTHKLYTPILQTTPPFHGCRFFHTFPTFPPISTRHGVPLPIVLSQSHSQSSFQEGARSFHVSTTTSRPPFPTHCHVWLPHTLLPKTLLLMPWVPQVRDSIVLHFTRHRFFYLPFHSTLKN